VVRRCTVCDHPARSSIDAAIIADTCAHRIIAKQYGVSPASVLRHQHSGHLTQALVRSKQVQDEILGLNLWEQLQHINRVAWELLEEAREIGDLRGALVALKTVQDQLALQNQLLQSSKAAFDPTKPVTMRVCYDEHVLETDKQYPLTKDVLPDAPTNGSRGATSNSSNIGNTPDAVTKSNGRGANAALPPLHNGAEVLTEALEYDENDEGVDDDYA
jgi:hypothetical protein